jgi:xanthine dehydrogenase YagS FAD-binding subunit
MRSFEYAAPKTLKEATQLLSERWGETEILAGGTDLVTCLKQGITMPKRVVSLRHLYELKGIRTSRKGITIGAMVTLEEFIAHEQVRTLYPSLVTAATGVGSPQILAAGTAGGDLCQRPRCWYFRNGYGLLAQQGGQSLVRDGENRYHAILGNDGPALFVSASSLGPALLALEATITAVGPGGSERNISAADFFQMPKTETERETALRPNEILASIFLPARPVRNATYEVRHRQGLDWPYVTASVAFGLENGAATKAKVVLGHVAPVPWPALQAGRVLEGAKVDAELATRCGAAATEGARPLSGNAYKLVLVKTAVRRAVLAAVGT